MNAKQKCFSCFSHQFRFADLPALAVVGLLSAWVGPTHAILFTPSVEVRMSGDSWSCGINVCPTIISSPLGPIIAGASPTGGQNAGVIANYGLNGAGVSMWATWPSPPVSPTGHRGWIQAESKWTDALTVNVPGVAVGTPVDVVFSLGLHGHMDVTKDGSATAGSSVDFSMLLNQYGSWITKPDLDLGLGVPPNGYQHAEIDVNEIQNGRFQVPNGLAFNLISELMTRVQGDFPGPYGSSFSVESAFGNTVEWLGASLWVGGTPVADCSITSGSGFDYCMSAPSTGVPEPGILALLGIGLACLGALRRFT